MWVAIHFLRSNIVVQEIEENDILLEQNRIWRHQTQTKNERQF